MTNRKLQGLWNLLGSAVAVAGGAFVAAKQSGATDEQAAIAAGYSAVIAVVQHLRGAPRL